MIRMPPGAEGALLGLSNDNRMAGHRDSRSSARLTRRFAATANVTVPLPLPVPPSLMLIHGECADADQSQPSGAATETDTVAPARATVLEVGDTV